MTLRVIVLTFGGGGKWSGASWGVPSERSPFRETLLQRDPFQRTPSDTKTSKRNMGPGTDIPHLRNMQPGTGSDITQTTCGQNDRQV